MSLLKVCVNPIFEDWVLLSDSLDKPISALVVSGLFYFLAHLSHRLRVSNCHWPLSVVRRQQLL